jgi:hypothetical protein
MARQIILLALSTAIIATSADQGFLPPRMLSYYVNGAATSGVGETDN